MRSKDLPDTPSILAAERVRALSIIPVSRETVDRLDRFVSLLLLWQPKFNLIASSSVPHLWIRHVADSLQLISLLPSARVWVDMGSGGGFPGLVIAIALADVPGVAVHLIETNGKKSAFLREAARQLHLPAVVHHRRIEDFVASFASTVDVVTARALAPLKDLLGLAAPLLERGAQGLFPKGQDVEAELTQATRYWNIEFELVPSLTQERAQVVLVRRASRRPGTNQRLRP